MACCVFYLQNCTKKHYIYTTNALPLLQLNNSVHNIRPTDQTYHKHPSASDTIQCIPAKFTHQDDHCHPDQEGIYGESPVSCGVHVYSTLLRQNPGDTI